MPKFIDKDDTISEKGQNSSTKMIPFQKRVKILQQKWYHFSQKRVKIPQQKWHHFRKGSKILNKNGTISENGQNSSTKTGTISGRKGSKFLKKWYHFRKGSKILNKNCTISEKGQTSSTKMVPFQSENSQNSSTKMVAFLKRVKIPQQR